MAKYLVEVINTQTYHLEIDTDLGPMDAQQKATEKIDSTHPSKQEFSVNVERMTA